MKSTNDYLLEASHQLKGVLFELSNEDRNKLRQCLLTMYADIARVCQQNGFTLMLGGGSVLGAIRHQGFIPWDDDMDLMMPREDYDRFIEIFESCLGGKYILSAPRTKKEANNLFAKVYMKGTIMKGVLDCDIQTGIQSDIFPIEGTNNNALLRGVILRFIDIFKLFVISVGMYVTNNPFYKRLICMNIQGKLLYYVRYGIGCLGAFIGRMRLFDLFDRIVAKPTTTSFCTIPTGRRWAYGECLPRDVFFPARLAKFEGKDVYVPGDVHTYLKNLYGDYMAIPPEEKRERHYYTEFKVAI